MIFSSKHITRIAGILFLLFIVSLPASYAQRGMNRHLREGNEAFENNQYHTAIEKYKKGFNKIKKKDNDLKGEISFKMGECYRLNGDFRRSRVFYFRAIRYNYADENAQVYLFYAQALQMNEEYEKAKEAFEKYLNYSPQSTIAHKGIESCEIAAKWQKEPTNIQVTNMVRINSSDDDFAPTYVDQFYSSIIFASNRKEDKGKETDFWTGKPFTNLYYAKKDRQGNWEKPALIDTKGNVNTEHNEGAPSMSKNFTNLYFTRCFKRNEQKAGCKIYSAKRSGNSWDKAQEVVLSKDSANVFGHPSVNLDETMIIFAAQRTGGKGGKDLYYSELVDGNWSLPQSLGDSINTEGDELFPFLLNDSVLYFSSNGHVGMGGLDIYRSEKRNGEWSKPINLRYPLNSVGDDFGLTMRHDREEGYFTSNRKGSRRDDIYHFINPPIEFTLKANITDQQTLQPVEQVVVNLLPLNNAIASEEKALADPKGFFFFSQSQIQTNTTYLLQLSKENYFSLEDTINTLGMLSGADFEKKYELQRIPDKAIVLPEILFELNKWDLQEIYQDSLQGLIQRLDANRNIVIELAAHTDSRADDEYNDILSQKRAEAVVAYLIDRGIDPDRLVAKGYGKRSPRVLENQVTKNGITFEAGAQLNDEFILQLNDEKKSDVAHQLNRRIEFRVIRKDFIPKDSYRKIDPISAVALVSSPNSNVVNFVLGDRNDIIFPAIINGYTFNVNYSEDYSDFTISPDQAKKFLNMGIITKDNFDESFHKYLIRGQIPNQTEIIINEIRIGHVALTNVKVYIYKYIKTDIQMGAKALQQFGEFNIDQENFSIIFNK